MDAAVIAQAQWNELSILLLDLKYKVCDDEKYVHHVHDTRKIVMYNNRIYVLQSLREHMLNLYHHYLSYPGATCLAEIVQQSCY